MAEATERRLSDIEAVPIRPASQADAKAALSVLKDAAKGRDAIARLLASDTPLKDFVVAALALSPFLRDTAGSHPAIIEALLDESLPVFLQRRIDAARVAWQTETAGMVLPDTEIMSRLRRAKREIAFAVALADLSRLFDARETTRWLSDFAAAAVSAAIDHLLLSAQESGKFLLKDPSAPSAGSGVVVLGMGKLGASELNYSSDIDLVVFYDPQSGIVVHRDEASETFARLLRRLIRILQERTGDGYVFRTDLRLRPDPGSTPLAIPVEAAMLYYESRGQNWERAAFIKARPVAGDIEAGERFLRELVPFVFRKYLDYAAIADIHS
ncbi:MAG TPA: bifunctional [glutamine synthetase] adenylyltransferase/[glutamine synthetase]-adenylyl-L-tyrosine phosphorylase, partial [Sinorhizobium sp.]|nr:bifunctional [glutamine synthetase] adenylyltransferase/[glutamine synthetase]-adenylyl-L-tyrosine phosphorylase [Sinorhizobium sp.]